MNGSRTKPDSGGRSRHPEPLNGRECVRATRNPHLRRPKFYLSVRRRWKRLPPVPVFFDCSATSDGTNGQGPFVPSKGTLYRAQEYRLVVRFRHVYVLKAAGNR